MSDYAYMNKLSANLRWLMDKNSLTEMRLSEETGVTQPTINRILSGMSADPRPANVEKLASRFGLSGEQLRTGNVQIMSAAAHPDQHAGDSAPPSAHATEIEDDIDALRIVVAGLITEIAYERPAEGKRLAARLKKVAPARFVVSGYLHGLLQVLETGSAGSAARVSSRARAKSGSSR